MVLSLQVEQTLILFAVAVTLHMVEEVIWLPSWSQDAGRWHRPIGGSAFAIAAGIYLCITFLAVYLGIRGGAGSAGIYLTCGLAVVMLVNILLPHAAAAVELHRYSPGLATSLFLILPSSLMLIVRALTDGSVSPLLFVVASLVVLTCAAFAWPWMMHLGDKFSARKETLSTSE